MLFRSDFRLRHKKNRLRCGAHRLWSMVKFVQMLFCDRNVSPRTIGQRRNIRLHGNVGLFTVRIVLSRNGTICTPFRESLFCEQCADNREIFRRFATASKYTYKITAFPIRFGCPQNGNDHFIRIKHSCNI